LSGFERDPETQQARLGSVNLSALLAANPRRTPAYVYDLDGIEAGARALVESLRPRDLVAYALKANSAGSIVRRIARAGCGADVVSGGELELALGAGIPARKIVMSGVAKSDGEIDLALARGIRALQVESLEELARSIARASAAGKVARVSVRINPGVEVDTHAHIATGHAAAKFGVAAAEWPRVAALLASTQAAKLVGISAHVGSSLKTTEPYLASARVVCDVCKDWQKRGLAPEFLDFGGGFGIDYGAGNISAQPRDFARAALELLASQGLDALELVVEPGRSLVGPFGVLVAAVIQSKLTDSGRWLMLDAGMNDLIRPALYGARHRIEPLARLPDEPSWRVVGPICESTDDFGMHDLGPSAPDYVVIRDAGAYGFTLASEYNGRALPAEVFLSAGKVESISASPGVAAWVERRLRA
jgi:diaminopimelate decarboxylase